MFFKRWKHAPNVATPQGASTLKSIFQHIRLCINVCYHGCVSNSRPSPSVPDTPPIGFCFSWFSLWAARGAFARMFVAWRALTSAFKAATKSWLREKTLRGRPLTPGAHGNARMIHIDRLTVQLFLERCTALRSERPLLGKQETAYPNTNYPESCSKVPAWKSNRSWNRGCKIPSESSSKFTKDCSSVQSEPIASKLLLRCSKLFTDL